MLGLGAAALLGGAITYLVTKDDKPEVKTGNALTPKVMDEKDRYFKMWEKGAARYDAD